MNTKLNILIVFALLVILAGMNTGPAQAQVAITITPDTLPNAAFSTPYSQQLTASGGTEPYTFSLVSGALPPNITLSSAGLLEGVPDGWIGTVMMGPYPIEIQVADANGLIASHSYDLVLDKGVPEVTAHGWSPAYWHAPFNIWADVEKHNSPTTAWILDGTVAFFVDNQPVPGCGAVPLQNSYYPCLGATMDLGVGTHTVRAEYTPAGGYQDYYFSGSDSSEFSVQPTTFVIQGAIFKDVDQSGTWDEGENKIYESGWTINLDQGCDGTPDYTITTVYGGFDFIVPSSGQCNRMTVTGAPGYQQTTQLADFVLTKNDWIEIGFYYPTITLSPSDYDLPTGNVGEEYYQAFSASGGTAPYVYSIYGSGYGVLPDGLTLSTDGVLSGTPTTPGGSSFLVQAVDATGAIGRKDFSLSIKTHGDFTFTSSANPSAPGENVTFILSATGDAVIPPIGLVTFFADGTAIEGCSDLYLNIGEDEAGNQIIGGLPATCTTAALAEGTHQITASYTDWTWLYFSADLTLEQVVAQTAITIGPDTLAAAVVETPYEQQITASGGVGPYTFALVGGALPYGFSLSSDGRISGLASGVYGSASGDFPITIQVQDTNQVTASRDYTFVLEKATPALTVYASGSGVPGYPIYWNRPFTLWATLQIGSSRNVSGTADFFVDGNPVTGCQDVVFWSGGPVACRDISMSLSLGAHTFTIDYWPTGFEDYFLPASGSGTFTVEPGSYQIMGTLFLDKNKDGVFDPDESDQNNRGWTINLDQGCNESVDYTTTTGYGGYFEFANIPGAECYRITEVAEPGWQQTNQPENFWLSGDYYYVYIGNYYPTITISPTDYSLPSGNVGEGYNQAFSADGGAVPYTFTIYHPENGDLPAGLTLSPQGVLSGTPTAGGGYHFTVQAEDANHAVGYKSYSLSIKTDGVFTITASSNPSALGDAVSFTFSGAGDAVYPPIGWVAFTADEDPIEGCQDLLLNYSEDGMGVYPATCTTTALTVGEHQITATYTDYFGFYNSAFRTLTQVVGEADNTPPVVDVTGVSEGATYILGAVPVAGCSTSDAGSGVKTEAALSLTGGSALGVGQFTATCSGALDNAGNQGNTAVVHYNVTFLFTGFTEPVNNGPVLNIAKAGQTIPLKWRITDANGSPITNLTSVTVTASSLACSAGLTTDQIEVYATGSSGLQNLGNGYYQWNWKTLTGYANLCKTLKLSLSEGAGFEHTALFQFKK